MKDVKGKKQEIIEGLEEKFISLGVKRIDYKNRVTLGSKVIEFISKHTDVTEFQIFCGEYGDILLRPMVSIPSKEAWIYRNPNVLKAIRKGLAEAKEKKTEKVKDLDKFLNDL